MNPKTPDSVAVKVLTMLAGNRGSQGDDGVYETNYLILAVWDHRTPSKALAAGRHDGRGHLSSLAYTGVAAHPNTPWDVAEDLTFP